MCYVTEQRQESDGDSGAWIEPYGGTLSTDVDQVLRAYGSPFALRLLRERGCKNVDEYRQRGSWVVVAAGQHMAIAAPNHRIGALFEGDYAQDVLS